MKMKTMRLFNPLAILVAGALVASCQAHPLRPTPLRLGGATAQQAGTLTVRLAPEAGRRTQYLAVQDWETAEGTLTSATEGVAPVTVQATAVLDPTTQGRTATLAFTGVTPGTGYTLTIRLKRRDASGTSLVVAEADKAGVDLVAGANTLVWDQPLVPRQQSAATATTPFTGYVTSLFGGTVAEFKSPQGLAFDGGDRLFVADTGNHRMRLVTFGDRGQVTTVIGSGSGADNGLGPSAELNTPTAVAFNSDGEMFIADRENNRIRKVTFDAAGYPTVSTLAGGSAGFEDGPGATAEFDGPSALAFDGDDNLWVADRDNNAIRKITFEGDGSVTVDTIAGTGAFGFADGVAADAQFRNPMGVVYDPVHDHIIVADTGNNRIRVLHQHNEVPEIETVAGMDTSGFEDGDLSTAKFSSPTGLVWGPDDCLYVADRFNHRIRRLTFASDVDVAVDTPAGSGTQGSDNGPGATATFKSPVALDFNSAGELFVVESGSHLIRKLAFTLGGDATVSTVGGVRSGSLDGPLTSPMGTLQDLAVAADGTIYVADTSTHRIDRVTFDGSGNPVFTVLAGTTTADFADGDGATARFDGPRGIVAGAAGEVFIADTGNNRIRKLTVDGAGNVDVTTVAGADESDFADGDGATARFRTPQGLCRDAAGNLFVADTNNHRIRKITFDGAGGVAVTTVAGTGGQGAADGAGDASTFKFPEAIAVASDGTLYVADSSNHRIRKITFDAEGAATVSTVAGTGSAGEADGDGATATFNAPSGIDVDAAGNVIVGDEGNDKIRKITFDAEGNATVSTLAGTGSPGFADGPGHLAQFYEPEGVAVGPDGRIYVADTGRSLIRILR